MKRFFFLLLLPLYSSLFAQLNPGFKLGAGTGSLPAQNLTITDQTGQSRYLIAADRAGYSIHGGLIFQWRMGKVFFLQPEILFQADGVNYSVTDPEKPGEATMFLNEKYQHLYLPISLGFRAGPLRFQGGVQGQLFLSSRSSLDELDGYSRTFTQAGYNWIAGAGIDIWKTLMLDFRYESRLNEQRDQFAFFGQSYPMQQEPFRLLASVGILLGKKQ